MTVSTRDREALVDIIDDQWTQGRDAYECADAVIAAGWTPIPEFRSEGEDQ